MQKNYKTKTSELEQELLFLTNGFDLNDWKVIRTPKYYAIKDKIENQLEKKQYTLLCVKYYLKNYKI